MTKREYFDLLLKSADDGTFPSYRWSGCLYRGDLTPGCKQRCAVGLLIPDERYTRDLEFTKVLYLPLDSGIIDIPEGVGLEDIAHIQNIHDDGIGRNIKWDAERFKTKITSLPCFQEFADA